MLDRAQQALHLLALDPVVETTADKNSYGFRQQRSCADAIAQCFTTLSHAPATQWILEGDIRACFDKISHDWLLANVPTDRTILQKWLKSGYMDKHVLHETTEGNRVSLNEAFEVLEPDDGKLSRPVLRGPGPSNGIRLLDPHVLRCLLRPSLTEAPSLRRSYPASSVLRASPPPHTAWPGSRELPVDPDCDHRWGFPCCA